MYIYVSGNEIISETKTISSIMITGALAGTYYHINSIYFFFACIKTYVRKTFILC